MIEASLTDSGEQLIWSGNPSPGRYALRKGSYAFLFGIFFFGLSLFWIRGASMAERGAAANFWMLVFAGAFLMLFPVLHFFRGLRTIYALTDRRAIIDVSGPFPGRMSVPLNQIPFVEVQSSAEGPGHVLFQELPFVASSYSGYAKQRDGFIAIADAAQVGHLLRSAIEKTVSARLGRS